MAKLSQRIRELRERDNLSQQALADIIGISKSSINMYERGEREPGVETLEAFADHFNVDMNYLLGWVDDPIDYENPELIASIPLSYMELCDNNVERAWKMMQVVDEEALAEFSAQQKQTTPSQKAERGELSIDEEVNQLLYNLSYFSSATLMLDGKPASPAAIDALRSALEIGVRMAREKEKEENGDM